MEFYRTCHLYHHGKLFYFLLNGGSDGGGRAGEAVMTEMMEGDKGRQMLEPHVFLFLFFFFSSSSVSTVVTG